MKFIEINGTHLQCEKEIKLLVITIDEKQKFDKHVNIIFKRQKERYMLYIFLMVYLI